MGNVTDTIERHNSLIQTTSGTVASIGLTKAGQKIAGVVVTPAVWLLNYAANGKKPDNIDIGLYATGFAGTLASAGAIGTGVVKAIVDDDIDWKLKQVRMNEDPKYRPFIRACYHYKMNPPQINAMTIASDGGTAWRHPNGLWACITDARGLLVYDFQPKTYIGIYRPVQPIVRKNGKFKWESIKK